MKYGREKRWTARWGLLLVLTTLSGCDSKKGAEESEKTQAEVEARDLNPSEPGDAAGKKSANAEAPTADASKAVAAATTYACGEDSIWTKKENKALQTGALESLNEGIALPSLSFGACEGVENCESLTLTENQKLLAVGQNGNDLKMVVAESCGENTAVLIANEKGETSGVFRGKDMAFEAAVVGGDRFLLSGFARHKSETAKEGFVPREYLVSGRQGQFEKLEPARNKQQAVPVAAASQIVQVKSERGLCTTMFWKLGVEQCDFEGPSSEGSVLIGSQMIYPEGGKGMKWNAKDGSSELLPALEWITTDGVNVLWSAGDKLFMTQPKWDLPKLEGDALDGPPGGKPVAFGCGRSLAKDGEGWHLRNLKMGNEWVLPSDRFGGELTAPVAMNCDFVLTADGKKFALKNLGSVKKFEDGPAKTEEPAQGDTPTPAPPTPEGQGTVKEAGAN